MITMMENMTDDVIVFKVDRITAHDLPLVDDCLCACDMDEDERVDALAQIMEVGMLSFSNIPNHTTFFINANKAI